MSLQPSTEPGVIPLGKRGNAHYLSPEQFMPMRRVMQMTPKDGAEDMPDLVRMKRDEIEEGEGDTADYPALEDTMRREGPTGTSVPPIWKDTSYDPGNPNGSVGNGGHRVSIAHDLGWKAMRHTAFREDSGYGDQEYSKSHSDYYGDEDESSYHNGDTAEDSFHNGDTPAPSVHDPRNHVPGNTGESGRSNLGRQRGRLWHDPGMPGAPRLGDKGPGPGLYTQLHPTEPPLQTEQFGRTKLGQNTAQRNVNAREQEAKNYQPRLSGMPSKAGDWTPDTSARGGQHSLGATLRPAGWKPGDGVETMRGKFMKQNNPVGKTSQALGTNQSDTHWPGGGRILTGDR